MMLTGSSGSGKTKWTRKLLLTQLIQPPPERILWCFGQWQPLYEDLQKRILWIEFVHCIPDYLNSPQFINPGKPNLIIFDDLMAEVKCDQRIADIFLPKAVTTEIYLLCTLPKTCFLKVKRAGIMLWIRNTWFCLIIWLTDNKWQPWQKEFIQRYVYEAIWRSHFTTLWLP